MDEIWERAVETALEGQTDVASVRALTLDGAVKCVHGRLPPPSLFEKFPNLQHLSIANVGVSSLEQFPRLQNLQRLILSDNRIAAGLKFLVVAGLGSLRDLDLSNNRIQDIDDLRPLAELKLVSLDLYECPVTRVKDYRSRVFGFIKSLKYLDKMDAEENERPESDDEDEVEDEDNPGGGEINGEDRNDSDEAEDDEEDTEDERGSGEINGEGQQYRMNNGNRAGSDGVIDVDEDEESDADEETETSRAVNGFKSGSSRHHSNGFRVAPVDGEDGKDGEENDSVDEIDDDDVIEVHEDDDSDDEEDVVEYDDDAEEDQEDDDDEVDNDEGNFGDPVSTGRLTSTEVEIDGHEQGEEDGDEDDNGETGEEEPGVEGGGDFNEEEADDDEEDNDAGYLIQPVGQVEVDAGGSDMGPVNEDDELEMEDEVDDEDDQDGEIQELQPSSSQKRKRDDSDDDW